MADEGTTAAPETSSGSRRLMILLAMAMFVLVVDTSLMNVSISGGGQGPRHHGQRRAVGDRARGAGLRGLHPDREQGRRPDRAQARVRPRAARLRRRGARDDARAGPDGRSSSSGRSSAGSAPRCCCRPCSRSIHGNFEGAAQRKVYALVGASAAIAAAVGPLLGGFITTYLSWRVGFALEVVIIAVVLFGHQARARRARTPGDRHVDLVGAVFSVIGMGGIVLSILVWQEGGEAVAATPGARRRRPLCAGVVARAAQAAGEAGPDRSRRCSRRRSSGWGSPARCSSRSRSAAR